jgi:putative tricarboxylic transport membrane protein
MTVALRHRAGPVCMGLALVALVAVAAWQVGVIPDPPAFAAVGPAVMPRALVGVLAVLAALYLALSLLGRSEDALQDEHESPLPGRQARVAWMIGGLAALLALTPVLGIGLAVVVAFVCIARAFDSRRWARDVIVALLFCFAIWYLFDRQLGVQLGPFLPFLS